jgi:hypothetical protein
MELNDYPRFDLTEDRRLYDALILLGYDGDASVYRCRLSTAHDMD